MRLRTFDGDGDTPEGASPPISKIDVRPHGRPLAPTLRIIAKIGAGCPTPRANFRCHCVTSLRQVRLGISDEFVDGVGHVRNLIR